jgi:hypothetical protein
VPFDQWLPNTKPSAAAERGTDFSTRDRLAGVNMKDGVPQPTQGIRTLLAGAARKIIANIHNIHPKFRWRLLFEASPRRID